jgi:hypothetical protein
VTQQIHIHLHRNDGAVDVNWDHVVVDYLLLVVDADASIRAFLAASLPFPFIFLKSRE